MIFLLQSLLVLVCIGVGHVTAGLYGIEESMPIPFFGAVVGGGCGVLLVVFRMLCVRLPVRGVLTFVASVLLALLLTKACVSLLVLAGLSVLVKPAFVIAFACVGSYCLTVVLVAAQDEYRFIIPFVELKSDDAISRDIVLDTSVIIDGRIADMCNTSFLSGRLVIPRFVLKELQAIADSSDALKRNRGRRGLEILNRIKSNERLHVKIHDADFPEISSVDAKLVKLAATLHGRVFTHDYNLAKVAELQNVPVLNINELANALKPVVLPGEVMDVKVIKGGKESDQGVAYLDDGTMIVIENGRRLIGKQVSVVVTSALQTQAGRMIFAKSERGRGR